MYCTVRSVHARCPKQLFLCILVCAVLSQRVSLLVYRFGAAARYALGIAALLCILRSLRSCLIIRIITISASSIFASNATSNSSVSSSPAATPPHLDALDLRSSSCSKSVVLLDVKEPRFHTACFLSLAHLCFLLVSSNRICQSRLVLVSSPSSSSS